MTNLEAAEQYRELEILTIPLEQIMPEPMIMLQARSAELLETMSSLPEDKSIQDKPVVLASVDGSRQLQVVDGFYRLEALSNLGFDRALATVEPMSHEELIDRRLQHVSEHRSVEVGRVVELAEKAWQLSGWADRLSLLQAVRLNTGEVGGMRLGLDLVESKMVRSWVGQKVGLWGQTFGFMKASLRLAEKAAPDLLAQAATRAYKSGSTHGLSPTSLKGITHLYGKDNHDGQRVVAEAIVKNDLSVEATEFLVEFLKEPGVELSEAIDRAKLSVAGRDFADRLPRGRRSKLGAIATRDSARRSIGGEFRQRLSTGSFKYPASDLYYDNRRQQVMRITNIGQANYGTQTFADSQNYTPNQLLIERDGAYINETTRVFGPFRTEVLNLLLATYGIMPPPTLQEFHTELGYAGGQTGSDLEKSMGKLMAELVHLHVQGLVVFEEQGDRRVYVTPLIVKDKRQP